MPSEVTMESVSGSAYPVMRGVTLVLVTLCAIVSCSEPDTPRDGAAPTVAPSSPLVPSARSGEAGTTGENPPTALTSNARCLPAVAAACGCVYPCSIGRPSEGGPYDVDLVGFDAPLRARVAPWCVGGRCTDAFHVELLCSAVCTPRPADDTCHFERSRCVSGSAAQ